MTTDISRTAWQIINTYELRPEIEEDFRQMKESIAVCKRTSARQGS